MSAPPQKTCPKCGMDHLFAFSLDALDRMSENLEAPPAERKPGITVEEWNKTHPPVPKMEVLRPIYLFPGEAIHIYKCPKCGYLEWWATVGEEMKPT